MHTNDGRKSEGKGETSVQDEHQAFSRAGGWEDFHESQLKNFN